MKQGLWLLMCLLLTACAVGPNYRAPVTSLEKYHWSTHSNQMVTAFVERQWWQQLADPQLSKYVEAIAFENLDVAIACKRLLQARSLQMMDYARGGPKVIGKASVTNEEISRTGRILGLFANANNPLFNNIALNRKVYQPGFDASWEIDVFGQNFRRNQQRSAQTAAASFTVDDTIRLIRAEIARSYIQLRATQKKIDITQKNIALQKQTLTITRQRLEAGSTNELDVALTDSQLKETEALLPRFQGEAFHQASLIAILMGKAPGQMAKQLLNTYSMPKIPKKVAVGVPSDLLRRRPDIIAAERNIAATTAAIGVAVADLYPKFNLVANYSLESIALKTLWNRNSSVWTLGPFMQWSLFQSGQVHANINLSQAQQEEAVLQYKKTVLSALQEAESSIQQLKQSQQTTYQYLNAVAANQHAVKLARQRYREGEDDILSVIQSQQGLLRSELNAIDAQAASLIQLVSVYKAVGGGWV
ncbi:efflux transporter outer membrane subunit [Legionella sp. W05-934-2]|uniref:efflux transporter outer membrane subunit n=1 Tax=Legionella sp. W05-934-2 TaxID=1198649 RepID=UPI00346307CE